LFATGSDTYEDDTDTADRACIRYIQVSTSGGISVLQDQDLTLVGGYLMYPSVTLDSAFQSRLTFTGRDRQTYNSSLAATTSARPTTSGSAATTARQGRLACASPSECSAHSRVR